MAAFSIALGCVPALAEAAPPPKIDAADTAWMIAATALVLMMTIPGLALFYCGMVRKKNVLATMAQSLRCATPRARCCGWSSATRLAFSGEGAVIGNLDRAVPARHRHGVDPARSPRPSPKCLFMIYQMTFAIITVALVAGSVADRMRFSAFVWFAVLWLLIVYVPIAHWVWGGGFLQTRPACSISPAARSCISMPASPAWSRPTCSASGAATARDNMAPYDLSLAVIGTGLLWVGWFGFNGGSALGANSRARPSRSWRRISPPAPAR